MLEYLGTITADATTAKNNTDTAVPFVIPLNARILLQPSLACYVANVAKTTDAVTAGTGFGLDAAEKFEYGVGERLRYPSVLGNGGTTSVKVFAVY